MNEIYLSDNKYKFFETDEGFLRCHRHGESWRNFIGDKAVHRLFGYAIELQAELDKYRWILVSEGLPEEEGVYFVANDEWGQDAYWDGTLWRDYEGGDAVDFSPLELTHWKPIILPSGE